MSELIMGMKKNLFNVDFMNSNVLDNLRNFFNKKKTNKNEGIISFEREAKVVDLDLTKISSKSINNEGYYVNELGLVEKLSDEAILFLRKMFKNDAIACNRVKVEKVYESDDIKAVDIDLATINLKEIHKDGYYFEKDGTVRKMTDEAILYLRKMFPGKEIAVNRECVSQEVDVIGGIKLVHDTKKHIVLNIDIVTKGKELISKLTVS